MATARADRWLASFVSPSPEVTAAEGRAFVAALIPASASGAADDVRRVVLEHWRVVENLLEGKSIAELLERPDLTLAFDAAELARVSSPDWLQGVVPWLEQAASGRAFVRFGRRSARSWISDASLDRIAEHVNQAVQALRLGDTPEVKALLDPSSGIDLSQLPRRIRDMIELLVGLYFDHLSAAKKREFVIAALELDPSLSPIERTGAMVLRAEPGMQKLLQLGAQNTHSEEMKIVLGRLTGSIPPMPPEVLRQQIAQAIRDVPFEALFESFDEEPLGGATIAQVHEVKLHGRPQPAVVKIQRPDLDARIRAEFGALREVAQDAYVRDLLEEAEGLVLAELDFKAEAEAARALRSTYHLPHAGIDICQPIVENAPHSATLLVMQKAPGRGLNAWSPENLAPLGYEYSEFLSIKARVLKKLVAATLTSALFGSGEVHADLHDHNILIDLCPKHFLGAERGPLGRLGAWMAAGPERRYRATVIDTGSCARLSKREQQGARLAAVGLALGVRSLVLEGLRRFFPLSPEVEAQLPAVVEARMKMRASPVVKFLGLLDDAVDAGAPIKGAAFQLNRARLALEWQYQRTLEALAEHDPKAARRFKPMHEVYERIGNRGFAKWVLANAAGSAHTRACSPSPSA